MKDGSKGSQSKINIVVKFQVLDPDEKVPIPGLQPQEGFIYITFGLVVTLL